MVKTIGKKEITESIKLSAVSAPSAEVGKIYFDSGTSKLKVSENGSTFVDITTGGAGTVTGFTLTLPATDHTATGIIGSFTAGENLAYGDVCYLKSDGFMWKADADTEATTKGTMAMATAAITSGNTGNFLMYGYIRDDTWTWTVAGELYVSPTPGNPTATRPSTTGQQIRIVGYAKSATVIMFNPSTTYLEI